MVRNTDKLSQKLNRVIGILSKSRHYVSPKILKNIYHLTYGSRIWGLSINTYIDKIIQKNAVSIITFAEFNAHTDPIFKKLKILKIKDHITLQNCLLVYDDINNKLPKSFNNTSIKVKDVHTITTRNANVGNLHIPYSHTTRYGLNSNRNSIDTWKYFTKQITENLSGFSRDKLKKTNHRTVFRIM